MTTREIKEKSKEDMMFKLQNNRELIVEHVNSFLYLGVQIYPP